MGWIDTICNGIEKAFELTRPAAKTLPALFILCEAARRPGLSAIALTAAIIQRLPEIGIETGVNPDGTQNKVGQFVRVMSEEIVKEIKDNLSVQSACSVGSFQGTGTGMSAAGPIQLTVTNTVPFISQGIGI